MMGTKYTIILILVFLSTSFNCSNPTQPPTNKGTLSLSLEDVSCTEAWVELKANDVSFPAKINLLKDDTVSQAINLNSSDTTIYIGTLEPNRAYRLKAQYTNSDGSADSVKLNITTLDTTSSNFTWQTLTLGGASSSVLYDVEIINENDIWAVGRIFVYDSTGQIDPQIYNAIHWNGKDWELKRIQFHTICGQTNQTPYEAKAVFAINQNEIWIAMNGDQIVKLENGKQTEAICCPWSFTINKIWGSSTGNDLFIVGSSGNMARYINGAWQSMVSGTKTRITDIWGADNSILATVTDPYGTGDRRLLQINSKSIVNSLNWYPNSRLQTVWFKSLHKIFIGGGENIVGTPGNWRVIQGLPPYYSEKIRGNDVNDVFLVGDFGLCAHFNGTSWHTYSELYNADETLYGLAINNNLVVAAGEVGNKALLVIGHRN